MLLNHGYFERYAPLEGGTYVVFTIFVLVLVNTIFSSLYCAGRGGLFFRFGRRRPSDDE